MYVNEEEKKYAAYLTQELRMAGFIVDTDYGSGIFSYRVSYHEKVGERIRR